MDKPSPSAWQEVLLCGMDVDEGIAEGKGLTVGIGVFVGIGVPYTYPGVGELGIWGVILVIGMLGVPYPVGAGKLGILSSGVGVLYLVMAGIFVGIGVLYIYIYIVGVSVFVEVGMFVGIGGTVDPPQSPNFYHLVNSVPKS